MSTRATYQIGRTVFYCHYDGYPEGAAWRFAQMVRALTVPAEEVDFRGAVEDRRGGFEYAFIRGVMDCEPTGSHREHGDTEHRYTLTIDKDGRAMLKHDARNMYAEGEKWEPRAFEDLATWLDRQRVKYRQIQERGNELARKHKQPTEGIDEIMKDFPTVVRARFSHDYGRTDTYQYATYEAAATIAARTEAYAQGYTEDNPNRKGHLAAAASWAAAAVPPAAPAEATAA